MNTTTKNPFENHVVVSTILRYVVDANDLKNFRLVNQQCFKTSLLKWRKTATLNIFSFDPAPSPQIKWGRMSGCYDALFAPQGSMEKSCKEYPLPTKLLQMPFQKYRYHNVLLSDCLPVSLYKTKRIFWTRYGGHVLHLQINSIIPLTPLSRKLTKHLLKYCANLKHLQFGPWSKYHFTGRQQSQQLNLPSTFPEDLLDNDDYDVNDDVISVIHSDSGEESDEDFNPFSSLQEEEAVDRKILENLTALTFHRNTNGPIMFMRSPTGAQELFSIMPNLKHLTYDTRNPFEKGNIFKALLHPLVGESEEKAQFIKLESLKFENANKMGYESNTDGILLQYLEAARPPLKEFKDLICLPSPAARHHSIFASMEGTVEKLDIRIRCGPIIHRISPRLTAILPTFAFPGNRTLIFTELTHLNLTLNYVSVRNVRVFDFKAFLSMPKLQVFRCNWNWNPNVRGKPTLSPQDYYKRWNFSIESSLDEGEKMGLGDGENRINLPFMKEFHLNAMLTSGSLYILRHWMENLKILETILQEKNVPFLDRLWPDLETFTNLPESTIKMKKTVRPISDSGDISDKTITEYHVGWWAVQKSLPNW